MEWRRPRLGPPRAAQVRDERGPGGAPANSLSHACVTGSSGNQAGAPTVKSGALERVHPPGESVSGLFVGFCRQATHNRGAAEFLLPAVPHSRRPVNADKESAACFWVRRQGTHNKGNRAGTNIPLHGGWVLPPVTKVVKTKKMPCMCQSGGSPGTQLEVSRSAERNVKVKRFNQGEERLSCRMVSEVGGRGQQPPVRQV